MNRKPHSYHVTDIYSTAQWRWIGDRWIKDGFSLRSIVEFLSLSEADTRQRLYDLGYIKERGNKKGHVPRHVEELEARKDEFNALWEVPNET